MENVGLEVEKISEFTFLLGKNRQLMVEIGTSQEH